MTEEYHSFFPEKPVPPKLPKGKLSKNAKRAWKRSCTEYLEALNRHRYYVGLLGEVCQGCRSYTQAMLRQPSFFDLVLPVTKVTDDTL